MTPADTQAPPGRQNYPQEVLLRPVSRDRRARVRFPVDLPFSYRTLDPTRRSGTGRILNLSSCGLLAACRDHLTVDTTVELTIEWPARLHGGIPLHLIVTGSIVRCETFGFAVASCQHRFQLVGAAAAADDVSSATSDEKTIPLAARAPANRVPEFRPTREASPRPRVSASLPVHDPWTRRQPPLTR